VAQGPEAKFRHTKVDPFLKKLPNTYSVSIQQTSIRGTPDKLICCHGVFIGLELKGDKGVLSKLQVYNLDKIKAAGGIAMVSKPSTWDSDKEILMEVALTGVVPTLD